MKRQIIEIDLDKCNGCGDCIPNCPEGALQIIDEKARLISDLFCDGLGACIGTCPQGAIETIEREAEPYDERKVMDNIIGHGENTIKAHLKHLKSHNEMAFYQIAIDVLGEKGIAVPSLDEPKKLPCGCPGTLSKRLKRDTPPPAAACGGCDTADTPSTLEQWPIQLKLLSPSASYFDNADLLVSADCVAHAFGGFQTQLLAGKILIVFCPKLDEGLEEYVEKLAEILKQHTIQSITIARMEVPCCGGTVSIVEEALQRAGSEIKPQTVVIGIDGTKQGDRS